MNVGLTREESSVIAKNGFHRALTGTLLAFLIIALIFDALLILAEIGSGDGGNMDEWMIIPFIIGFFLLAVVFVLSIYFNGRMKDKEKALFLRTSLDILKKSNHLSARTEKKIFRDLAKDLVGIPKSQVVRSLVDDGWPNARAKLYTELVESLIVKCEWNINYEDQVADFVKFLQKLRWTDNDINVVVDPVVAVIRESGGRSTVTGVTVSIAKNIMWIIIILIMVPIAGWLVIGDNDLDLGKKVDYTKFILMAIPAVLGLGINIASIIKKLGRRPRDTDT